MRFKIDENLPSEIAADLRVAGHEADTVDDEGLAGAPDDALLKKVRDEHRTFLTMDKGVADVRVHPPRDYAGLVLFRPRTAGRGAVLAFVHRHLPVVLQGNLAGRLIVVSDAGIRVR